MFYKVGSKVRLKRFDSTDEAQGYRAFGYTNSMLILSQDDTIYTIYKISDTFVKLHTRDEVVKKYYLKGLVFFWVEEWLEPVVSGRAIKYFGGCKE